MKEDKPLFQHILESIGRIESYVIDISKENFLKNFLIQDAVTRNLIIIGEASRKVIKSTREQSQDISWRDIIAMRNMIIHEYFRTDNETVWTVIQHDLPEFKAQIANLLESIR